MLVNTRSRRAGPRAPAHFTNLSPSGGRQRCSRFAGENVCADALKAERKGSARSCAIEKRTSIARSICCQASNLNGHAIVALARNRPANDRHTDNFPVERGTDRKNMPDDWWMMSVMLTHESVGFGELEPFHSQLAH